MSKPYILQSSHCITISTLTRITVYIMSSKPTRFLGQLAEFRHNMRRNRFFSLQHILLFLPTSLLSKTFLIFLVCSASPLALIRSPSFDVKSIFFSFSVKCSVYVHQCCTFCVAIQNFFFSILNHSGTITNHHNCITIYTTTLDKTCWDKSWKFSKFKKWLNFSNSKFSPLPANINVESGQVLSSKA